MGTSCIHILHTKIISIFSTVQYIIEYVAISKILSHFLHPIMLKFTTLNKLQDFLKKNTPSILANNTCSL